MTIDYHREGTALGCVTLCAHCGYAIQLRLHRWEDVDRPGVWHEGDFWDHFVDNVFTCHTAIPKRKAVFWKAANDMFEDEAVDAFEQPYMDDESDTVDGRLPQELWEYMADRWVTTKETS